MLKNQFIALDRHREDNQSFWDKGRLKIPRDSKIGYHNGYWNKDDSHIDIVKLPPIQIPLAPLIRQKTNFVPVFGIELLEEDNDILHIQTILSKNRAKYENKPKYQNIKSLSPEIKQPCKHITESKQLPSEINKQLSFVDDGTIWSVRVIERILDGKMTPDIVDEPTTVLKIKVPIIAHSVGEEMCLKSSVSEMNVMFEKATGSTTDITEMEVPISSLFEIEPLNGKRSRRVTLIDIGIALQEHNTKKLAESKKKEHIIGDFFISPIQLIWIYAIQTCLKHGIMLILFRAHEKLELGA
jgi:hypothetical protein